MALRPEHLPAVAKEFDRLLRERAITREQAEHFCDRTFAALLEHRMRTKEDHPYLSELTPESKPETTNAPANVPQKRPANPAAETVR